jgi:hypothetical protein
MVADMVVIAVCHGKIQILPWAMVSVAWWGSLPDMLRQNDHFKGKSGHCLIGMLLLSLPS